MDLKTASNPVLKEEVETKRVAQAKPAGKTIYFIYNGHEWEAFEVLGLSADSTLLQLTSHYQNLIKTADPSTFDFYDAAYSAILKTRSKN